MKGVGIYRDFIPLVFCLVLFSPFAAQVPWQAMMHVESSTLKGHRPLAFMGNIWSDAQRS